MEWHYLHGHAATLLDPEAGFLQWHIAHPKSARLHAHQVPFVPALCPLPEHAPGTPLQNGRQVSAGCPLLLTH